MLYSASLDFTARRWIKEFGDCMTIYKGHNHTVNAIKLHKGFSKCTLINIYLQVYMF